MGNFFICAVRISANLDIPNVWMIEYFVCNFVVTV